MILSTLKQRTQPYHSELERDLGLLQLASIEAYAGRLQQFLGFYAPLEAAIARLPGWGQHTFDLARRQKTALLQQDLRALGLSEAAIAATPICADLPAVPGLPQALGCMYVFEGATLGGQLISRHLHRQLGITPASGCAFFSSYGENVGPMWVDFRDFLASYTTANTAEPIVAAACHTFITLGRWLIKERAYGFAN